MLTTTSYSWFHKQPILVTGAPRSGTTFLGRMLEWAPGVTYLDEPFNYQMGIRGVNQQFAYISSDTSNEAHYARLVDQLLKGRARFKENALSVPPMGWDETMERFKSEGRQYIRYKMTGLDWWHWRYLLKDPMACFSAEYLHRTFRMATLILVRRPTAVVASYRRLGWRFNLNHLKSQPRLMRRFLDPILADVDPAQVSDYEEGALLWSCIYSVLADYAERNPDMLVIRHEDFSSEPEEYAELMYERLGLEYTPWAQGRVRDYTDRMNEVAAPNGVIHELRRNSRALALAPDLGLSEDEVKRVEALTAPIARRFYGSQSHERMNLLRT